VTFTADAQAQSAADKYPDKPIKIIVPFAPGGSADILSRVVGNKLTESFGQTIVVETRPGAGTVIGTTAAAKAEPDGYTLLMTTRFATSNRSRSSPARR
jgi:tripartite-type tricarboxylate transporter receptor subunit TctC